MVKILCADFGARIWVVRNLYGRICMADSSGRFLVVTILCRRICGGSIVDSIFNI